VSTPDPDSETAVTSTPAQQTPAEPSDATATDAATEPAGVTGEPTAPTKPVEPAEKAEKVAEEPADAATESLAAVDKSAEPGDKAEPADEATEPVEALAKPAGEADDVTEPVVPLDKTGEPTDEHSDEPTEALATAPAAASGLRSRRMLVPIVLAVLALGSAVAVAVLGRQAFSDARTQRAQDAALEAARTSTTQVLSYDSKTLDADLARSRSLISGAFAAKFEELASGVIEPAVKQQSLGTKATVARSAVIDAQPDQVRALLFVNQSTTVGADPTAHTASNQVRVTMTWTDGRWLISDLQPL
jgi:Mce-associated membrane protein